MEPVTLFDLAAKQSQWLAVRQSAIAGNIANANTPGYVATDVEPFEKLLDRTIVHMSATQSGHLGGATEADYAVKPQEFTGAVMPSKNTVVLESELMKAGEIQQVGKPEEVYHRPVNLFVADFLGPLLQRPRVRALVHHKVSCRAESQSYHVIPTHLPPRHFPRA